FKDLIRDLYLINKDSGISNEALNRYIQTLFGLNVYNLSSFATYDLLTYYNSYKSYDLANLEINRISKVRYHYSRVERGDRKRKSKLILKLSRRLKKEMLNYDFSC